MTYDFASRHDRLRTRMREVNSTTIDYARGETTVEGFSATVYEMKPDELMALGLPVDTRRREYIFDIDEIAEEFTVPRQADEITDGSLRCKVVPQGDEPCFRWTNHQRNEVRVHAEAIV